MFSKLNQRIDDLSNEALDEQHMVRIMTAETKLCIRKGVPKEYLINHLHYLKGEKLE